MGLGQIETGVRHRFGADVMSYNARSIDAIPAFKGGYIVGFSLELPIRLTGVKFADQTLLPGDYLYFGRAHGSGGVKARLRRHLRLHQQERAKCHWHVDQVSIVCPFKIGFAFADYGECELLALMAEICNLHHPINGFGASDCRACISHFAQFA